jgi:hypothetical protein
VLSYAPNLAENRSVEEFKAFLRKNLSFIAQWNIGGPFANPIIG